MQFRIENIKARQIIDSRGNPTVEVEIRLANGVKGRAAVPAGASTGEHEAVELRDGGDAFCGLGVERAVENVNRLIDSALRGTEIYNQKVIDDRLVELDGTKNKSQLGANAILGVSLAVAVTASKAKGIPLFQHLGGMCAHVLPAPMMNILNGGLHAANDVDIQEFMIVPGGAETYSQALRWGVEVFHALRNLLDERGLSTGVGDEGGFAPDLESNREAMQLLVEAIERVGYRPGEDVQLALDVAASEMYREGDYYLESENRCLSAEELVEMYAEWLDLFPIVSIEDGLDEEDWHGWKSLTDAIGERVQLVGDDLFATNVDRLERGLREDVANSILIKPNQCGTLSETLQTVERAARAHYSTVISHRSGETTDTTIADLSVGLNTGLIKAGAPSRGERTCKYNRLLRIEDELQYRAEYAGWKSLRGRFQDNS